MLADQELAFHALTPSSSSSSSSSCAKMGMKAQDTSELFFEDLRVPASAMLGQENKGFYAVMNELPQERLLIADMAVASAEAVFEWTKE